MINFYNPCKKLQNVILEEIVELSGNIVVWCGDFNSHNTLWGSESTDYNGKIIEEILDENGLVCINDGSGTRINIVNGHESMLELTFVSENIGNISLWKVLKELTLGSDHYPIRCRIGIVVKKTEQEIIDRWQLKDADWERFSYICSQRLINNSLLLYSAFYGHSKRFT